jgi:hypothetical protein
MNIGAWIKAAYDWTWAEDYRTWIAHMGIALGLLALPSLLALTGVVDLMAPAGCVVLGWFALREAEDVLMDLVFRDGPINWVDHGMDLLAPTIAVLAVGYLV